MTERGVPRTKLAPSTGFTTCLRVANRVTSEQAEWTLHDSMGQNDCFFLIQRIKSTISRPAKQRGGVSYRDNHVRLQTLTERQLELGTPTPEGDASGERESTIHRESLLSHISVMEASPSSLTMSNTRTLKKRDMAKRKKKKKLF